MPDKLITNKDLGLVSIHRVIFHDVPNKPRGSEAKAVLSDVASTVDATRKLHLKNRLVRVLASKNAYSIKFKPDSGSLVPSKIREMTSSRRSASSFVRISQQLANYLLEQQLGSVSPGLLCVIGATVGSRAAVMMLKLEREEGAQLNLIRKRGKQTFSMSVLDNLVLTDGTRLFKTAMFVRDGLGDYDFRASACDSQLSVVSSEDLAKFWLRFLGCTFLEEPRVATQRFFESALRFANAAITDPVEKSAFYDHLQSQLTSEKPTFAPKRFIEDYVAKDYRKTLLDHLEAEHVALSAFRKDLSDIRNRLRRKAFETTKGGVISVPADIADIVEVRAEDVLVKDSVVKVR